MNDNVDTTKEWRKNILKQVAQARIAKGMSQAQLAELLGIQRSSISRLESGEHNPSLDSLLRVMNVLDIDIKVMSLTDETFITYDAYELRLYDKCLLTFTLEEHGIDGLVSKILDVDNHYKNLLPLDLELTGNGVVKWLKHRIIPKNRAFADEILKTLDLSIENTKSIIDACKGLSLNDSYWVVPNNFNGSFMQYNLYENRFSETLSLVAYTGIGQNKKVFTTSPELTTNGTLPKAWRLVEGDGIYLYKAGSSGAASAGNEPFSEYYACQIAQAMGLNAVTYDLENWRGSLASKCKLFTDINTAFIPVGRIVPAGDLKACMEYYAKLGDDFVENMRSMLVLDAVIYNVGRHFESFGILRDNLSDAVIGPAPLYDHGLSLFNFAMSDDIVNLDEYATTCFPAYTNVTFESICSEVIGKTQTQQLKKLIGFEFKRHSSINWSEERLVAIERHLQKRVHQLLAL